MFKFPIIVSGKAVFVELESEKNFLNLENLG